MRLWSIHPSYLDTKGLVALWREALLAKKVLEGKTKGYTKHPELNKFKEHKNPIKAINTYLHYIRQEACKRGYCFDKLKINKPFTNTKIKVSKSQVEFEFQHLKNKLKKRAPKKYKELLKVKKIKLNQIFKILKSS